MFLDSVGIILKKNHLLPHKVCILDKMQGKIECINSTTTSSPGALITYNIQQRGFTHFISDNKLIYIPLSLAQTDMLFFHHILELIYYFTNIGNSCQEVFNLLAFLYSTEHILLTIQSKKFFLLKLLTSMGSMPEISTVRTYIVNYLNTLGIEELNNITLSISDEKKLDSWLWSCIWQHPYVNEFKTIHFLAKNRAL